MIDLSKRVFVDKPTLIRERFQKARLYVSKHGYLKLFCSHCNKLFFCSGKCVFHIPESEIFFEESILGNTCLCEMCDAAKGFDSQVYKSCGKDDQIKMVMKAMAEKEHRNE